MVEPKKGAKWPKDLPKFKTRQEAIAVCKELCNYQYMHRSEKRGKGDLVVSILMNESEHLSRLTQTNLLTKQLFSTKRL